MAKQPSGGGGEVIAASRWVFTPGVLRINIGQSLSRPWIIRSSNLWQPWIISAGSQLLPARYPPQSLIVAPTDDRLPCHKWQPPWKVSQYWKQIILHHINPINFLGLLETMSCCQFIKCFPIFGPTLHSTKGLFLYISSQTLLQVYWGLSWMILSGLSVMDQMQVG